MLGAPCLVLVAGGLPQYSRPGSTPSKHLAAAHSQVEDGIAELVIESPPVNALDSKGWRGLSQEIDRLNADDAVRVIVIRAEGKGFCAGVDIKELQAHPDRIVEVNAGNYETFRALHRGLKPAIAAPHGYVLGGGIGICGSVDIILASGGVYTPGSPTEAYNLASGYLRAVLGWMGLTDVNIVLAGRATVGATDETSVERFREETVAAAKRDLVNV